jgi:uncharacterized membrane protein YcaP (DUF421 family)
VDIAALFRLSVDPVELLIRGSAMYWFLFLLFRFVLRRDIGAIGIADVLLVVLIADASQNAMSGAYESITDGCLLVATLVGWNYAVDWASYRFEAVRRVLEAPPLLLVREGRLLRGNMHRELVTVDELMSKLRQQGIEDLAEVKKAYMESDGEISVIRSEPQGASSGPAQDKGAVR